MRGELLNSVGRHPNFGLLRRRHWIDAQPADSVPIGPKSRRFTILLPPGNIWQRTRHALHDVNATVDGRRDIAEILFDLRVALDLDQRVVTARHDALAEKNLIQLSSLNNSSLRKIRPFERHRSILRCSVAGSSMLRQYSPKAPDRWLAQ